MPDRPAEFDERLLARFVPMSSLDATHLRELAHHARMLELAPGESLSDALSRVESVLYLVDGALSFSGGGQPDVIAKAGDPGSRFALPDAESRAREVFAVEPTRVLQVSRAKLSTTLIWAQAAPRPAGERDAGRLRADIMALLLESRLFERIPPGNIERVGDLVEAVDVKAGDVVVRQGGAGDHYYVIESGRCEVLREPDDGGEALRLAELGPGDSFGEEALLTDSLRNASVRMLEDGTVMRLTRSWFVELVSAPLVQQVTHERAEDLVATGAGWIDVRLPEEFQRDGLDGAVNLPLGELRQRAAELSTSASYVTYCNTGPRAQAGAFLLSQRGLHVSCLRDGIAHRRPGLGGLRTMQDSLTELRAALLDAEAELDRALERKAEADAARDVEQRQRPPGGAEAEARARLDALTEKAEQTSARLREAMGRKRELDSRVREVEAREATRRRAAEAECARLRIDAEQRLQAEKERLSEHYRGASERLRELDQARRDAEARFEQQRARMERELCEARARMEAEAARIREAMDTARRDAEARALGIRGQYQEQEQTLRRQTEEGLRQERGRLEEEFAASIAAQERARQELEQAETERLEAEQETRRLQDRAQAERLERKTRDAAARAAEVASLRERSAAARGALEAAQAARDAALARRESYAQRVAADAAGADPEQQARQRGELASVEADLASADDALEEAARAAASAANAEIVAEETAAAARSRADELRLEVYEEMETWVSDEAERSREALDAPASREALDSSDSREALDASDSREALDASDSREALDSSDSREALDSSDSREALDASEGLASQYERVQAQKDAQREAQERSTVDLMSDLQQMLGGGDPLADPMRLRMAAEEKARLVQQARRAAAEQTARAREAVQRQRASGDGGPQRPAEDENR